MPPKSSTQEQFSYCNKCKLLRTARLIPSDALQLYSIRAVYFRKTTGHKLYQFVIKYIVWNKFTWQQRLSFPRDSCMHAQLCPTLCDPQTVACQAPFPMEFFRQEYWSGLPFPTPEDLPNPRIEPQSLASPALAGRFLPLYHLGSSSWRLETFKLQLSEDYQIIRKKFTSLGTVGDTVPSWLGILRFLAEFHTVLWSFTCRQLLTWNSPE